MKQLLAYAHLTVDKANRDTALEYYENRKPNGKIEVVSHDQAVKNLHSIKKNMGELISRLPKNLMISGSTAIACVINEPSNSDNYFSFGRPRKEPITPHDVDIYINDNDHDSICQIDAAIRQTYDTDIIITRTQYIINWFLKDAEKHNYPNIQLILPPARHWSEVFSSYHCDLVCIGYLVGEEKFVYARGRWDRFYETGVSYCTASFSDSVFHQKVADAATKYRRYGFTVEMVSAGEKIIDNGVERSPKINLPFEDIGVFFKNNPKVSVGKFIHNVYSGELIRDYVEIMSIFVKCYCCGTYQVKKKICDRCRLKEAVKLKFVQDSLRRSRQDIRYLVTGGRCGLGYEIAKALAACDRDVTVTTRFPQLTNYKKTIKLDMKDNDSVEEFEREIENFDVLILSAAEIVHYSEDNLPTDFAEDGKLDWTNDYERSDTGVWQKCIDEHSNEEIEDAIQINITSTAKIIRSFIAHQIRNKSSKPKTIIYVTSSEGLFIGKSPFHPITNMTKSAVEQLICTMKRQADVLGMNIVMADPGWMYTKSKHDKKAGPITIEWGAAQVLLPIVTILNGQRVLNASLWSRKENRLTANEEACDFTDLVKFKGVGETCPRTLDESNVMMLLKPCRHKLGLPAWYQLKDSKDREKCPLCKSRIDTAEIAPIGSEEEEQDEEFKEIEELEEVEEPERIDEEQVNNQLMEEMVIYDEYDLYRPYFGRNHVEDKMKPEDQHYYTAGGFFNG